MKYLLYLSHVFHFAIIIKKTKRLTDFYHFHKLRFKKTRTSYSKNNLLTIKKRKANIH